MSQAVKAVRYLLVSDATIGGLVSTRCFPADAIPKAARKPYLILTRLSDKPDRDLNGNVDQRIATLQLEIVSSTYSAAATILAGVNNAIDGGARTVNGVAVNESEADDAGDEPEGPIDTSDGTAFVATVEINIAYIP